jgi:hypothetical protein
MLTSTAATTKPVAEAQQLLAAHAQHAAADGSSVGAGLSNGGAASLNSKFPMMQHHLSLDASRTLPSDLQAANQELVELQERDMRRQPDTVSGKAADEGASMDSGEPMAKRVRAQQGLATAVPEPPLSDQEAAMLLHHVETIIRQRSVSRLEQVGQAAHEQAANARLRQLQTDNAELQVGRAKYSVLARHLWLRRPLI